jgi:hypothetical protein
LGNRELLEYGLLNSLSSLSSSVIGRILKVAIEARNPRNGLLSAVGGLCYFPHNNY